MYIKLTYLAFDKGGNPHRYVELDKDEQNPNKGPTWYPCLYDAKTDYFLGPIWVSNERGKSVLLDAKELAHMTNSHWIMELQHANTKRYVHTTPVPVYLPTGAGAPSLVPEYDNISLCDIKWEH